MKSIDGLRRGFNVAARDQIENLASIVDPGYRFMRGDLSSLTLDEIGEDGVSTYTFDGTCNPMPVSIVATDAKSAELLNWTSLHVGEQLTSFYRPDEVLPIFAGGAVVQRSLDLFVELATVIRWDYRTNIPGDSVNRTVGMSLWGRTLTGARCDVNIPLSTMSGFERVSNTLHPFRTRRNTAAIEMIRLASDDERITKIVDKLLANVLAHSDN